MVDVQGVLGRMKICILIPVHNEANGIDFLIEELKKKAFDVIVVDDGSTDESGLIAKEKGAIVLTHPQKMGKGVSLRDGFDYAIQQGYEGLITMDGDRQHDVKDLTQFILKAKECHPCVIAGSRMRNYKGMPFIRLIVNRIMSAMVSMLCRQSIPDTQCGFRFISCEILGDIQLSSGDFEIESEVLIKASRKGYKIYSVPIKTIYRNELSKINPCIDTIRFLAFITREMLSPKS